MDADHDFISPCELDRVVDGDTVDLIVDLGFKIKHKIRVRLLKFAAPDPGGDTEAEGQWYSERAKNWFFNHRHESLFVETRKLGKYGRWTGEVFYRDAATQGQQVYLHEYMAEGQF